MLINNILHCYSILKLQNALRMLTNRSFQHYCNADEWVLLPFQGRKRWGWATCLGSKRLNGVALGFLFSFLSCLWLNSCLKLLNQTQKGKKNPTKQIFSWYKLSELQWSSVNERMPRLLLSWHPPAGTRDSETTQCRRSNTWSEAKITV